MCWPVVWVWPDKLSYPVCCGLQVTWCPSLYQFQVLLDGAMCVRINIHPTKVTVDQRNKSREFICLKQQPLLCKQCINEVSFIISNNTKMTYFKCLGLSPVSLPVTSFHPPTSDPASLLIIPWLILHFILLFPIPVWEHFPSSSISRSFQMHINGKT